MNRVISLLVLLLGISTVSASTRFALLLTPEMQVLHPEIAVRCMLNQMYDDFRVVVVDDAENPIKSWNIRSLISNHNRGYLVDYYLCEKNTPPSEYNSIAHPDEVVLSLCGDPTLYSSDVLQYIDQIYEHAKEHQD